MIVSFSWRYKEHLFVILEYAFAVRKISHVKAGIIFFSFFHFRYITWKGSTVTIKFFFKRFNMVMIPMFFKLSFSQSKYTFFESQVVAAHLSITLSFLQSPFRGDNLSQLYSYNRESRAFCVSFWTIFLLCPLIICYVLSTTTAYFNGVFVKEFV